VTLDVAALGAKITRFREVRGMSLSALAEAAELAKSYLAKLEKGEVENPGLRTLSGIARALDVTVADLLAPAESAPRAERKTMLADTAAFGRILKDLPEGLKEFLRAMDAAGKPVPPDMIRALASVQYRGKRPHSPDDWRFLYDAIRRSVSRP
jgi:transcriptional regulator with XRE-family HTH domain